MKIKISDIDVLSDDKSGNNRFVIFSEGEIELEEKTIITAKAIMADSGNTISCEIYKNSPNNEKEPPHMHLRAKSTLGLKKNLKVGDYIVVEN